MLSNSYNITVIAKSVITLGMADLGNQVETVVAVAVVVAALPAFVAVAVALANVLDLDQEIFGLNHMLKKFIGGLEIMEGEDIIGG